MIGDTPEQIEQCLNCTRLHCTNCMAHSHEPERKLPGKAARPIARFCGDTVEVFASIREASRVTGIARATIYGAIRDNRKSGGYYWRFED